MLRLNETLRFRALDYAKRLNMLNYYRKYIDSFSWSRDELVNFQNEKLQQLLNHAYKHVPYYKDVINKLGARPEDFKSIKDLTKLPVLTREDIAHEYYRLIDRSNTYKHLFHSSTSGTTGIPMKYIHDAAGEGAGIAAGYALFRLSGWRLGEKTFHIWGNPESIKKWRSMSSKIKRKVINQFNYPAFLLNDVSHYEDLYKKIISFKPRYIDGYASSIASFALWMVENKKQIHNVSTVFTTAENLTENNRYIISKQIAPVSDLYGCGEVNGIAIQPIHKNKYYVLEPHVIVESVKNDYGVNELVVTDLDNKIMPFIRYKPGDTIDRIVEPTEHDDLPFINFGRIGGRTSEYIKLADGKVIHPVNLLGGTFLRKYSGIKKHKVIWNGKLLIFEIESAENININDLNRDIGVYLTEYGVDFEVRLKDKILPDNSGKHRYIEINIDGAS